MLSTSPVENSVWDWESVPPLVPDTLSSFSSVWGGENQQQCRPCQGFTKPCVFWLWQDGCRLCTEVGVGECSALNCARSARLALLSMCILSSADAKSMGTRTATSSYYFLLVCVSQCNVQLVELFVFVSMVGVWWALTKARAPCLISDIWRNFISCYIFLQENPDNILEGKLFCPISPSWI